MYQVPGVQVFKDYFDRGQFAFGEEVPAVRDKDIETAMGEALTIFNADIYPDEKTRERQFLYLTAHFLACDLDAAESGGLGGIGFVQTSRSADGLSESIQVPEWVSRDPMLSVLAGTYFGRKYLITALQYATDVILVAGGDTLP